MDDPFLSPKTSDTAKASEADLKERRRLQNRLAQRNHRRRKAAGNSKQTRHDSSTPCTQTNIQNDGLCSQCRLNMVDGTTMTSPTMVVTEASNTPDISAVISPSDSTLSLEYYLPDLIDITSDHEQVHTQQEMDELDMLFLNTQSVHDCDLAVTKSSTSHSTSKVTRQGSTTSVLPLHLAAEKGYSSVIGILLSNGAHVDARDDTGRTALHYAAKNGHTEALKLLLSWGGDPLVMDFGGLTALHQAAGEGHEEAVRILIDHGADPNLAGAEGIRTDILSTCI
ncbi:ankyrin repeat-containing domain protein [Podospora fimiseda]|uniref:Ankyrin repeat-containing domain protein n=1 Tax=Podospora fimiseda TaxID=252190 RepID=A0AAN7BFN7_9PEZI|nr:ankyrin repeat-containing domain protein [Podospora fimiseda]